MNLYNELFEAEMKVRAVEAQLSREGKTYYAEESKGIAEQLFELRHANVVAAAPAEPNEPQAVGA